MDVVRVAGETFWSTNIWLPPNTTWVDIAPGSRPDVTHADYRDLIWPIPMAVVIMLLRYAIERYMSMILHIVSFFQYICFASDK